MGVIAILGWFVLLGAAFFFLVVRPQRRQMAAHRALVEALAVDDEVITTGGIHGTIRGLTDDAVELEIATGVVVRVARGAIAGRLRDLQVGVDDAADDGEAV
jgi:preprotein translocase subunit YajC